MSLRQVFPVERIKLDLESEDKEELFEELVDVYAASGAKFADRKSRLGAVKDREALMSTGIMKGVAIPHGKTAGVDGVFGVIGVSKKGIDYESLDGEPVFLVFLIVSSPSASELHLKTLKKLAILLKNEEFKEELQAAVRPDEAYRVIERYENLMNVGD